MFDVLHSSRYPIVDPPPDPMAWIPPIGIPIPVFGIIQVASIDPDKHYYIDETNPNSTDSGNPLGTISIPRKTIPMLLSAGSVVELNGSYSHSHSSPNHIILAGSINLPVFIRAYNQIIPPVVVKPWEVHGSYYVIEHINFASSADNSSVGTIAILAPSNFGALRYNNISGNLNNGGMQLVSFTSDLVEQFVVYKNIIHNNGDINANFDQDVHGIAIGQRVNNIWIIDNEISFNSGDGLQINAGTTNQSTTHHIYVGRNISHHNKQSGLWTKQSVDVIFSENTCYGHRPSNSSLGAGLGGQYGPERVWYINNHIYDCDYGIIIASTSNLGTGLNMYFMGNLIHNIHSANPTVNAFTSAGISLWSENNKFVVGNTIYDVDAGINSPAVNGTFNISNNIIGSITKENHFFFEQSSTANASTLGSNLLDGEVKIRWGSSTVYNFNDFKVFVHPKADNLINAPANFISPVDNNFHLAPTSVGIDSGLIDNIYDTFFSLYGIDISLDLDKTHRPQGSAFDLGAYEFHG